MVPVVHYFWIGPPGHHDFTGMDTVGPKLLRAKVENHIYFWCLNEHVRHYERQFLGEEIRVLGIQSCLKVLLTQEELPLQASHAQITSLIHLIELLLNSARRQLDQADQCREYVTVKALMQYFTQIYFSGYFLDTNVLPEEDMNVLPAFDKFFAPYAQNIKFFDPWLMYSPYDDNDSLQRFTHYFNVACSEFYERAYGVINREKLSKGFVDSLLRNVPYPEEAATLKKGPFGLIVQIPSANFYKRYHNSHKRKKAISSLSCMAYDEKLYLSELLHYLRTSSIKPYQLNSGSTLLKEVVKGCNEQMLDIVLQQVAAAEVKLIFTPSTSFIFYLYGSNHKLLYRLLSWYIENQFESIPYFLRTVFLIKDIILSKNPQHGSYFYYVRNPSRSVNLMTVLEQCNDWDNQEALQIAMDLVIQIGDVTNDTINCYVKRLTDVLIGYDMTHRFFSPGNKKQVQQMILARLGYSEIQLAPEEHNRSWGM